MTAELASTGDVPGGACAVGNGVETPDLPYGFEVRDDRIVVVARRVNLSDLTDGVLTLFQGANDPAVTFVGGEGLTRIRRTPSDDLVMERLDTGAVSLAIAREVDTVSITPRGRDIIDPPERLVSAIMSHADPGFPQLVGIARSPLMRPDGVIVTANGYDASTRLYFDLASDLDMPPVAEHPTSADVEAARNLLTGDLLGDFLWDDASSLANAVGLILTPVVRQMFDGCVPLHAVTANQPGTGKTLLCNVVGAVATGAIPTTNPYPGTTEELRKLATSIIRTGPAVVLLDNVEGVVKSRELARLLTSEMWGDRLLGVNTALAMPNRATWMMTGNAVRFGGDLARRVAPVMMTSDRHDPWNRSGFNHPNLTVWVAQNRGRLLWACFALARSWIASGRPDAPATHGGGFDGWSNTVGGILAHAGIGGFLGNLDRVRQQDWEGESWSMLLGHLLNRGYTDRFKTSELLDRSHGDPTMLDLLDGVVSGSLTPKSLGEAFARRATRWHVLDDGTSAALRTDGTVHGGARAWTIERRKHLNLMGLDVTGVTDDTGDTGDTQPAQNEMLLDGNHAESGAARPAPARTRDLFNRLANDLGAEPNGNES